MKPGDGDRRLYYHDTGDGAEGCITMKHGYGAEGCITMKHGYGAEGCITMTQGDGAEGCITMTLSLRVVREPARTSKEPAVRNSEDRTKKQRVTIAYS